MKKLREPCEELTIAEKYLQAQIKQSLNIGK